eukprot:CFRG6143T1
MFQSVTGVARATGGSDCTVKNGYDLYNGSILTSPTVKPATATATATAIVTVSPPASQPAALRYPIPPLHCIALHQTDGRRARLDGVLGLPYTQPAAFLVQHTGKTIRIPHHNETFVRR